MKKLFGVMVLAVLPVACGSTIPSGPDAALPVGSANDATVTSLRTVSNAPAPTPVPNCSTTNDATAALVGIKVLVMSNGDGFAVLQANPVIVDADTTSCFTPVWTLSVKSRKAHLEPLSDRRQIMLVASAGQYQVTASSGEGRSAIRGTAVIEIK